MATVAVIWQSLGPYHAAHLAGARSVLARAGWRVAGVEVATQDGYRWKDGWTGQPGADTTLFADETYEVLAGAQIAKALAACLTRLAPDAVAVNGWASPEAVAALRWCRRSGAGAIVMSETHVASGNPAKEWLKRRRLSGVRAVLTGGRWHADYADRLGVRRDRIALGYDAVDNAHFRRGADEARGRAGELRARLGLPERYFFACSRLIRRKNLDGLVKAFAGYVAGCGGQKAWSLVIAGDGEERRRLESAAARTGVEDRVQFRGAVCYDELPTFYGLAAGFVHVAHREAWGLVINEACAAGLPLVVGSKVGAACELACEGENGWLVESGDSDAIARGLARLAALSDAERAAMGEVSRRLVAQFGPPRFGEGLLACVRAAGH